MVGKISIGALFLAGVVPGIVIGLGMMAIIYVIAHRRNYETERTRAPLAEVLLRAREAFWALLMPAIILGGIVFGVFTATEAAAIAVMYALIVGFLITRELHVTHVIIALRRAVIISAVVFLLVGMSNVVSFLLSASMAPIAVAEWIKSISDNPLVFLLVVNLILLALGCFLDNLAIMIMAAPVLAPVAASFGIDPLHFGFVFVLNSVIGMLTPPVGAILFTVCGVSRTSIESVTRELWPFLLWQLAVLALVTYVPAVSLALPKLAGY